MNDAPRRKKTRTQASKSSGDVGSIWDVIIIREKDQVRGDPQSEETGVLERAEDRRACLE